MTAEQPQPVVGMTTAALAQFLAVRERAERAEAKLAKLDSILAEYRKGEREFPMYAELSALLRG